MLSLSKVSTIPDGNEAVESLENEIYSPCVLYLHQRRLKFQEFKPYYQIYQIWSE